MLLHCYLVECATARPAGNQLSGVAVLLGLVLVKLRSSILILLYRLTFILVRAICNAGFVVTLVERVLILVELIPF